jgi:2-polyprenyl-3-methyl-5-hydroxy-6-metoxy-1,4-benzoquinol methylase
MSASQTALLHQESRDQIRSRQCPTCFLCGARGELLYEGMEDSLFGAPGIWNFKLCPNSSCGLIWLDPMPLEEDIGNAYNSYHTHQQVVRRGLGKGLAESVEGMLRRTYNLVLLMTPISREREQLESMYVGSLPPGKVLDVGCGSGNRLARFRSLGWDAQGQEVDPAAAAEAQRVSGASVHLGPLEEAGFQEASFDAITMNHVIEHVYDPVRLLQECRRLLRRGGTLVTITPNAQSHGHDRFGTSWRGLEPPRHLHLFSPRTLYQVAVKAGFLKCDTWTSAARSSGPVLSKYKNEPFTLGRPSEGTNFKQGIMAALHQFRVTVAHRMYPHSGEECILKATK